MLTWWCAGAFCCSADSGTFKLASHGNVISTAVWWPAAAWPYRAELQTTRKQTKETLEEYASRVRRMVGNAYPDMVGTSLCEDITIEYVVGGLNDQNLIYEVLTKKPKSVEGALDLIRWHESCKCIQKRCAGVRQVTTEDGETTDVAIKHVGGKTFVTEERLNQCVGELGKSLREAIRSELRATRSGQGGRGSAWKKTVECYNCREMGHIARDCPSKGEAKVSPGT